MKETILVIDDNAALLESLQGYLEDRDYRVLTAENGRAGLEKLEAEKPDLVLTDLRMPEVDGIGVLKRAQEVAPDTPTIVVSGTGRIADTVQALKYGAWDYILKPVEDMSVIGHAVEKALEHVKLLREKRDYQANLEATVRERTAELEKAKKTMEDIIDHNPMSIQIVDAEGRTLRVNAAHDRLFGQVPSADFSVFRDSQMARKGMGEYMERVRKGEVVHFPDFSYEAKDSKGARKIWIRMVGFPLLDAGGKPERHVLMHEDVTARKEADEERERLQSQLAQSQKMESVGRLAGGVAHDFNNMLGVILGYTEMALEGVPKDQPLYEGLLEIRKATDRSADLTRQLLAFARKQTISPRVLDLNETVEGMLKMLRRLIGEQVNLEWLPGPGAGQVKMDPSQIDQILVNLCVNARDAIGERGDIRIETGSATLGEEKCAGREGAVPGEYLRLKVEDTGCGMDAETLAHAFEPFYTTKKLGSGTGLGLATVHGIVRQNKGFIEVSSEPGKGTTFEIYLPRFSERAAPEPAASEPAASAPAGATVLLVEDEPAIMNMVRNLLVRQGYRVLSASSPTKAIEIAGRHGETIDLLLTDMVMPEMNGRDLARNLPSLHPQLRCLFMSGHSDEMLAKQGIIDPGVQFIQKPFTMKGLLAKVAEAMNSRPYAQITGAP